MPQNNGDDIVPVPVINPDLDPTVDLDNNSSIPDYPRITRRFRAAVIKVLMELGFNPAAHSDSNFDDGQIDPVPQNDDLDGNTPK